jgi:hypothetical protein
MFIPDPDIDFLPIPDPGAKKAPDPGSAKLVGRVGFSRFQGKLRTVIRTVTEHHGSWRKEQRWGTVTIFYGSGSGFDF